MRERTARWVGVAGLVAAACGRDDRDAAPNPGADAGADHGSVTDPNGTFDRAVPLEVGAFPGVLDVVEGREDVDFFSFQAEAGTWVSVVSTSTSALSYSDTALTLFGPNRKGLAWNQYVDPLRGESVLARIVTRLPETGTYFVSVRDREALPIGQSLGQPYRLSVVDLSSTTEEYAIEADPPPSPDAATAVPFRLLPLGTDSLQEAFVAGAFSSATDVDAFSFDAEGAGTRLASVEIMESGLDGDGSTTRAGKVWVTDSSGKTALARIDNTKGQKFMRPPLDPGHYLLWVSHPDAALGSNDFYVVRLLLGSENPAETADAANGALGSAEPLEVTRSGSGAEAYLLSYLEPGDVDYFRFDSQPGESASAYCSSSGDGSGVVGLRVALLDETSAILAEGTETPLAPAALEGVSAPAKGALYLRVTADSQLPDVAGNWAHCSVFSQ